MGFAFSLTLPLIHTHTHLHLNLASYVFCCELAFTCIQIARAKQKNTMHLLHWYDCWCWCCWWPCLVLHFHHIYIYFICIISVGHFQRANYWQSTHFHIIFVLAPCCSFYYNVYLLGMKMINILHKVEDYKRKWGECGLSGRERGRSKDNKNPKRVCLLYDLSLIQIT